MSSPGIGKAARPASPRRPAAGQRVSRKTIEGNAAGMERRRIAVGFAADDGATHVSFPLKRGRFSASPATGLIGLQENGFLDDFFECLSFLSLANESTIRRAMVRIMRSVGTQHSEAPPPHGGDLEHPHRNRRAVLIAPEEDAVLAEGRWSDAVATAAGGGTLPSDASTCLLWCAIALGALVRGCPLTKVAQYFDLAQGSLSASVEVASFEDVVDLDTARAHVAMGFFLNFLGHQRGSHEHLQYANEIVSTLPPEILPTGINEVLRYARKAWVFDGGLASAEESSDYWENTGPFWRLSDTVVEHDVSGLIISVDIRVDQAMLEERVPERVFLAEEQSPESAPAAAASTPSMGDMGTGAQENEGRQGGLSAATSEATGINHGLLCAGVYKQALPEMLRLRDYLERSKMRSGLGGIVYYMRLGYLQFVNNHFTAALDSFRQALDTILRYPGVCRYSCWSHFAHCQLWCLAFCPGRERYEELRAVYNPVRPAGYPPAPPFEEWRGMSDICDHPYCRLKSVRYSYVSDYLA